MKKLILLFCLAPLIGLGQVRFNPPVTEKHPVIDTLHG
jgi:hypothetical protein